MTSPSRAGCRRSACPLTLVLALSCPGSTEAAKAGDGTKETRVVAVRFLADWNNGRLGDSYAGFTARLQQLVTVTQLQAALAPVREALGKYVATEDARFSEDRIDEQRAVVLDATLRFERGTTSARFAAREERGAWRLRYVKIDLPLAQRPPLDDAPVKKIADELLVRLEREGVASAAGLLPQKARDQFGEQAVREAFERTAHTLGAMRSHALDKEPLAMPGECRQLTGRGRFEHGQAALRIALCADEGLWRLLAIDIAPEMTPLLLQRLAWATLAQTLKRTDFELTCPPPLVAVGREAVCRFTSRGQTRPARVRRVEDADVEVVLAKE